MHVLQEHKTIDDHDHQFLALTHRIECEQNPQYRIEYMHADLSLLADMHGERQCLDQTICLPNMHVTDVSVSSNEVTIEEIFFIRLFVFWAFIATREIQ